MVDQQKITAELYDLQELQILSATYEEISSRRMRRIRGSVFAHRDFYAQLDLVYQEIKLSYSTQIKALMQRQGIKHTQTYHLQKRNGKTVAVFLAANTKLYGPIVNNTLKTMLAALRPDMDVVILGRLGKTMFEASKPNYPFTYFDFPDTNIDEEALKKVIQYLIHYEKIYIFFGKFTSITSQTPIILDVYVDEDTGKPKTETKKEYVFEPSLEKILLFFENEIFSTILKQTLNEAELGKIASRILSLDSAIENVKARTKVVKLQQALLKHRTENKKQNESFASMVLWN